jgi:hypothetical protein
MDNASGESEAIILVKGLPQIDVNSGETVCYTGVSSEGAWVRLYVPQSNAIEHRKPISRWKRVKFKWKRSAADSRLESRDVDPRSIVITGELPQSERFRFLNLLEVNDLNEVTKQGKSLALLRPKNTRFFIQRKTDQEMVTEKNAYQQAVMRKLSPTYLKLMEPCIYRFKFHYETDQGAFDGTYHNSEINAVFFKLAESFGEPQALIRMIQVLGKEYPSKGMIFAMEQSLDPSKAWFINSIIVGDEVYHMMGDSLNVVA